MLAAAHSAPTRPSRSTALARRWWTITPRPPPRGPRDQRRNRRGRPSVRAGLGFARAVGGLEAVAAATGLGRVGVVDGEAAAHELIDEVDLGALEVLRGE